MILGIVKMNSCVTSKLPIINKKLPCDNRISFTKNLQYIVNKHQCYLFTVCSFFNKLFTVTGNNNNIMYSKNRIANRKFHSKLPIIVFLINSITLIESEEFRETSNKRHRNIIHINPFDLLCMYLIKIIYTIVPAGDNVNTLVAISSACQYDKI